MAANTDINEHPIHRTLGQLQHETRTRLQDEEEPTNRDVLWRLSALIDLMLAQFEFSQRNERAMQALRATCAANHPVEKSKTFGTRVRDKVVDIAAYAIAGMAVLAVYWVFMQVTQSGISLPTP